MTTFKMQYLRSATVATAAYFATCFAAGVAQAHVSMWPRESVAGTSEKYTVRVPTEGKVATTKVELMAPEGVTITILGSPDNWKQEVKRDGDRIVGITWHVNIPPAEFMEFEFLARNPKDKTEIVFDLKQTYADGKVDDMTHGPQGLRPSAIVKLKPGAQ